MNHYVLLILGLLLNLPVYAAEPENNPQKSLVANPQALVLLVQEGKSKDKTGSNVQQFQLTSGESIFIQTNQVAADSEAPKPVPPATQAVGNISQEIAQKIGAIAEKQRQIDTEVYTVYKAPLEGDKRVLENDLRILQARREQLQSQITAQEIEKEVKAAANPTLTAKPVVRLGYQIKVILNEDKVIYSIRSQAAKTNSKDGKNVITLEAPLGKWLQLPSTDQTVKGKEIWIKVDKTSG